MNWDKKVEGSMLGRLKFGLEATEEASKPSSREDEPGVSKDEAEALGAPKRSMVAASDMISSVCWSPDRGK